MYWILALKRMSLNFLTRAYNPWERVVHIRIARKPRLTSAVCAHELEGFGISTSWELGETSSKKLYKRSCFLPRMHTSVCTSCSEDVWRGLGFVQYVNGRSPKYPELFTFDRAWSPQNKFAKSLKLMSKLLGLGRHNLHCRWYRASQTELQDSHSLNKMTFGTTQVHQTKLFNV